MTIFTRQAQKNILATGNVWGHNQEYFFNFKIELPFKRYAKFKMKRKPYLMGRFGGGWDFVLGVQIGGSTVIFNLGIMMIRVGVTS